MKKDIDKDIVEERKEPQDVVRNFFKELVPYIVIVFVVALIRTFIATPVRVNGDSMYPYLKNGEILVLSKLDNKYKRNDVIVANALKTKIIKRVIAVPGENVEYKNCKLYINGEEVKDFVEECITEDFTLEELYGYVTIPDDYYFVMGDNRKASTDSRDYRVGLIKKDKIQGKVVFRLTPFKRFGTLK